MIFNLKSQLGDIILYIKRAHKSIIVNKLLWIIIVLLNFQFNSSRFVQVTDFLIFYIFARQNNYFVSQKRQKNKSFWERFQCNCIFFVRSDSVKSPIYLFIYISLHNKIIIMYLKKSQKQAAIGRGATRILYIF